MNAYEQGFMDKCAELSIDPEALLKTALVSPNTGGWRGRIRRFMKNLVTGDTTGQQMEQDRESALTQAANLPEKGLAARALSVVKPDFRQQAGLGLESLNDEQIRNIMKLVGVSGAAFGGGMMYNRLNQR